MPVNHKISVYLYEKGSKSKVQGNGSRTSAATTLSKNTQKKSKDVKKTVQETTQWSGLLSGPAKVAGVIYAGLQTASKVHDVWLDYKASISGNAMTAGNIKKAKNIVLGFGIPYAYEALKNEFFTKNIVHRENISNQYYRDLYFEKYEGNQYDGRTR